MLSGRRGKEREMDLLLIPLLLVVGAALTFLGINGFPSVPGGNQLSLSTEGNVRPLIAKVWLPRINHERPAPIATEATVSETPRPASLDSSDLLLNDVLSELIEVREELSELRSRVDSLTPETPAVEEPKQPEVKTVLLPRRPTPVETIPAEE